MVLDGIFNPTLGWVLNTLPSPWGLLLVSFLLTLLMTLAYKYFTDQNLMKSLKEEMKAMQNEVKGMKDQPDKMMAKQKDLMDKNLKYMKQSFKPMLITFLPMIVIFGWLRGYYTLVGEPKVLFGLSWLWAYIIFSIVLSFALRKLFKVH